MRLFSDASLCVADPLLRRAYQLAEFGRGFCAPNPMVGCVVVRDGAIVGEGYHAVAGGPHAEVTALAAAGPHAAGADVYVTLEPCNHWGRTGPCTDVLASSGVRRVFIGMADPTPQAGGGAARLREHGIDVEFAADPSPFVSQNEAWLKSVFTGTAFLQVKVALTLDGRPALERGRTARISGDASTGVTMRLRAGADAVAVGNRTLSIDAPSLTVRDPGGSPAPRQPVRVVIARSSPVDDAFLFHDNLGPVLILAPEGFVADSARVNGLDVETYDPSYGLRDSLRALCRRGIQRVLLEAGPGIFTAAWEEGIIDELVAYYAGGVAGSEAPSLYEGTSGGHAGRLLQRMAPTEVGIVGEDVVSVWRPRAASAASAVT